jgi:hypothetical protein
VFICRIKAFPCLAVVRVLSHRLQLLKIQKPFWLQKRLDPLKEDAAPIFGL